ncbi:MAG: hypothetical protein IPJ97_11475 [Proteobacteria bacterium]|nr:hypothetical protein [Pseudomonadota bacterium]
MHTHVQQVYRGVPVFGGEAIVHLSADGKSASLTDDLLYDVQVDTTPTLSAAAAIRIAVTHYGCETCLTAKPKTDLWVMRVANRAPDVLVYRVQLRREDGSAETALPVYFIDAHTGAIEMNYNNLQSGTGLSLYSGTRRTINTFYIYLNPSFPTYFMEDHIRNLRSTMAAIPKLHRKLRGQWQIIQCAVPKGGGRRPLGHVKDPGLLQDDVQPQRSRWPGGPHTTTRVTESPA